MGEQEGAFGTRRAGVLLHVTSLPGAGDLGDEAYRFVDFLATAGCTVWQVLPLVPTHPEDRSPYNALSTMAGNPELVSRERQSADGLADPTTLDGEQQAEFVAWCAEEGDWLEPYVEFMALREAQGHTPWRSWPPALRDRDPGSVAAALAPLSDRLRDLRLDSGCSPGSGPTCARTPAREACSSSATCRSSSRSTAPTCGRPASCSGSMRRAGRRR